MQPLICPQCGGQITEYAAEQTFTRCGYCSTKFVIRSNLAPPVEPRDFESPAETTANPNLFVTMIAGGIAIVVISIIIGVASIKKSPKEERVYGGGSTSSATPYRSGTPVPTPDPNLLSFGGKGTGNGLFQEATSITVDNKGRIYVADESMRVQMFDDKGEFLKVWQIPTKTDNYSRARTIDKVAAGEDGKLYVAVGGVVLTYDESSTEYLHAVHAAPDYIVDFAFRSDGGLLLVVNKGNTDQLIVVNKKLKVLKRIDGFVTDAADASMSPQELGVSAIRIAVDGPGNIFAVYAFGDLGSYQLSYRAEDLMIFRFSPDGKYVDKFVHSMSSCGIAVDGESKVYITNDRIIDVYTNSGEQVGLVTGLGSIDAFTLDKQGQVYILSDDIVVKRPAIK